MKEEEEKMLLVLSFRRPLGRHGRTPLPPPPPLGVGGQGEDGGGGGGGGGITEKYGADDGMIKREKENLIRYKLPRQ